MKNPVSRLNIGEKLCAMRLYSGHNRMSFFRKTGIPKATTLHIESGKSKDIQLSTLYKYAYGLGISVTELVDKLDSDELCFKGIKEEKRYK